MTTPLRVLLPFDESQSAKRAVQEAMRLKERGVDLELHVLNVQPALRSDVTRFVAAGSVAAYHHDEGAKVLAVALTMLHSAGMTATEHVHVGEPAEVIAHVATALKADIVLMGTHGRSAVAELLMGSVATGVIQAVHIPVMLIR